MVSIRYWLVKNDVSLYVINIYSVSDVNMYIMFITILSFPYAILFFSVINKFSFVLNNFSGIKERIILIKYILYPYLHKSVVSIICDIKLLKTLIKKWHLMLPR